MQIFISIEKEKYHWVYYCKDFYMMIVFPQETKFYKILSNHFLVSS